jgi:RNA-splicing ligase RtcB
MKKKIKGRDLIAMGYQQGKWFRTALEHVNTYRLEGDKLKNYLDHAQPTMIEPLNQPYAYSLNIKAESELEQQNVDAVIRTMNEVMKTPTVIGGAVMPDACPAGPVGTIPVGGVVKTRDAIHPAMHSADICCSVMMTNLGHVDPKVAMDAAHSITHFGGGGRKDHFDLPDRLRYDMAQNHYLSNEKSQNLARTHLGTQGDGNHFLYIGQLESTGETVMVTHHGSRGLGAHLYTQGMRVAERYRKDISPGTKKTNAWIPYCQDDGKAYWEALQLVRQWTKLNHQVLHQATYAQLDRDPVHQFWNEHNFVFREGDDFYHAKGATPLDASFVADAADSMRLIPLNMSEPILIVDGETTSTNMGFAPHGAGRNMSRTAHKRTKEEKTIDQVFAEETEGLDVRFFSGHIDISELPSAYKNAATVQQQMKDFGLGNVTDRVLPYGSIMAGDWQVDAPWRKRKSRKDSRSNPK